MENVNPTVKRVYVGTDNILKAYMVNNMSISEIKEMLALGATITDEGIIVPPEPETESTEEPEGEETTEAQESAAESETSVTDSATESDEETTVDNTAQDNTITDTEKNEDVIEEQTQEKSGSAIIPIVVVAVAVVAGVYFLKIRKKK